MTDPLEAARAYVAAGDALNSPDHASDVEKLRELSNRVREREAALEAAQAALFGAHQAQVQSGEAEAAPNVEAAQTIAGKSWTEQFLCGDHPAINGDNELFEDAIPEEQSAKGNGGWYESNELTGD